MSTATSLTHFLRTGRRADLPDLGRPWKVWDLDAELRYAPVVEALPDLDLPICEVGSGPTGLAGWTGRPVLGVDPGADDRHGAVITRPNFSRLQGDGANIPLPDRSVAATVAVDTFEHIPPAARPAVLAEMKRVTADGGRVIVIGPSGPAAVQGDRRVLERWKARGRRDGVVEWLGEHFVNGLPTADELVRDLGTDRVLSTRSRGVFNVKLWWLMHRVTLEDFPAPRGFHVIHHLAYAPFGAIARSMRRGPHYRLLFVADIGGDET